MYLATHHTEDLVELIKDVPDPGKTRIPIEHFYEDTASAPHVQAGRVVGASQQHVWWPVPEVVKYFFGNFNSMIYAVLALESLI